MNANKSVTATFKLARTLTVSKSGSGSGTVTSDPAGISCGVDCSQIYADGASVVLTATATAGSLFTGWSGDCSGTNVTCTVVMDANKNVTATFKPVRTLIVTKSGSGSGTVTSDSTGIDCGADCSESYVDGASVTLTATATAGSVFTGWSGDCSGTDDCTLTMNANKNVTATFKLARVLTVSKSGSGSGTVTSDPAGISCGSDCSQIYADGASVVLTATATAGSVFTGWSGDCSGSSSNCTLTMSADKNVTATFTPVRTLTVTRIGPIANKIISDPDGISCSFDCAEDYVDGASVTLTAIPTLDAIFIGWSGDCSGASVTCTVIMDANKNVTATFKPARKLTVTKTGAGSGTVTSDPSGINCGADCAKNFLLNTHVTLTATADAGSIFTGWSGDCTGTSVTCTVTMSIDRSVVANFISPMVYWKFDEAVGIIAADSSGQGNDGVHFGSPVKSANVAPTNFTNLKSLIFDGVNDYVKNNNPLSSYLSGNLTLAFWFKTPTANISRMVDLARISSAGLQVGMQPSGKVYMRNPGDPDVITDSSKADNVWHHVAVVRLGFAYRLYIDGSFIGLMGSNSDPVQIYSRLFVGARSNVENYFNGRIDDVRVYNEALSAAKVAWLASGN